jgi:hypothetical protein
MTEALGGWFAFGAADRIVSTMERVLARMRPAMPSVLTEGSDASATLSEILLAGPPKLDTLLAHSKGSLVAAHALKLYVEDLEGDDSPLYKRLHIVTLGAVVGLPPAFKKVKQYLGAYDWFGGANSSLGVVHERVPGVSHHLNPGFPYHMSVASLLNGGAAPRLLPKPPLEKMVAPLSLPPVDVPKPKPVPVAATVKAKEPVRQAPRKAAKPPSAAPKAMSPAPKAAAAAPKAASPAPKIVSSTISPASGAPRLASAAAKAASSAPRTPASDVKRPSVKAKPAVKPVPRKVSGTPRAPLKPAKAKTAAANGKLVAKTSRKGGGR